MQREQRQWTARPATPDDVPAAAGALARAFEDDPAFNWVLPKAETRAAKLTVLFGVLLSKSMKMDFHEIYTTPEVAGVAAWGRPGAWRLPTRMMLPSLPRLLLSMGIGGTVRFMRLMLAVEKRHPEERHWYLAALGTDPPKQRMGVGKTLVAPVLERCDKERLPAYLETQKPENVPYYERMGFKVTGEFDIPGGGPHLWLMWRDPL
jgi:GNAT superfamily N-acetyltransferase